MVDCGITGSAAKAGNAAAAPAAVIAPNIVRREQHCMALFVLPRSPYEG
jgi:hypothetical protein